MATPDNNRTTRKPSRLKNFLKRLTLKSVLKAADYAYLAYRAVKWIFRIVEEAEGANL